jgi:tetratricopeptide (TPR) repeat protein
MNSLKENLWYLLKNADTDDIAHLLRAYIYIFMAFGILLLFLRGLMGLLIAAVVSIPFAFVVSIITNKAGGALSKTFYGGRKPTWTIQEKFQSTLDQVMFLKRQKQFPQALAKVNEILSQEPDFSEALFLKAQILWEGYKSAQGAKRCLDKAKDFVPPHDHLYSWICNYDEMINDKLNKRSHA